MKYVLKNSLSGLFLVVGSGFVAETACKATKFDYNEALSSQTCAKSLGVTALLVQAPVKKSFAVNYVRPNDLNGDGTIKQNVKNPSRRRFATREEANAHGSRFGVRKAKGSRVSGSAGHIGFYVTESTDPVNATVNPETGLTNSIG